MSKPFGSWDSPITPEVVTKGAKKFADMAIDQGTLYWIEGRPEEKGRCVIMKMGPKGPEQILKEPYSARSKVHEYGGGAFLVHSGAIYFVNATDQNYYCLNDDTITQITDAPNIRFADGVFDSKRNRIYCVAEEHGKTIENRIVSINVETGDIATVAQGADFYAQPTLDNSSNRLAYISWNHPNLPWDGTTLTLAKLSSDGMVASHQIIAGGPEESIYGPIFTPKNELLYASDRTGFWNLYCNDKPLCKMDADFGGPHWIFGEKRTAFIGTDIACIYTQKGCDFLALIDLKSGEFKPIDLPFSTLRHLHIVDEDLFFQGSSATNPLGIYSLNLNALSINELEQSQENPLPKEEVSKPQSLSLLSSGDRNVYAFYYPPLNSAEEPPENTKPPLIVKCHGGPTAHATPSFNLEVQYWTSRGFGYMEVNYSGSSGYGREYRNRLRGNWGIVDVEDVAAAARYAVEQGLADSEKIAVRGSSAGGYTTLEALCTQDVFKAGTSLYGIADLEMLDADTHKFEAEYTHSLLGRDKTVYKDRSPINHTSQINVPVLIFQGEEDSVVPPSQAHLVHDALDKQGSEVRFFLFPGESHGFRKAETIQTVLREELSFYQDVFGLISV